MSNQDDFGKKAMGSLNPIMSLSVEKSFTLCYTFGMVHFVHLAYLGNVRHRVVDHIVLGQWFIEDLLFSHQTYSTFHVVGEEGIRVFVEDPKQLTVNVGDMARFTCVGIYPQVRFDVCITLMYKPAVMRCGCCPWSPEMPASKYMSGHAKTDLKIFVIGAQKKAFQATTPLILSPFQVWSLLLASNDYTIAPFFLQR